MSTLQKQAKALGDPTRHHIFELIVEAENGLGVAALTGRLGVHHNAVRQHLAKLVDADLVVESSIPAAGPGRPKLIYRVAPAAESRWGAEGPYERLAALLAEVVRTGDAPAEVGRRSVLGRNERPPVASDDSVGVLVAEMERIGFEPTVRRQGARAELVLGTCPFASTAQTDPDTVCELHLGMARGVAELVDGLVIDRLDRRDPHVAGCRLRCHVESSSTD